MTLSGATFWKHPARGLLNVLSIAQSGETITLAINQPPTPDITGIVEETSPERYFGVVGVASGKVRRPANGALTIDGAFSAAFVWGADLLRNAGHSGCGAADHSATFVFTRDQVNFPPPGVANTLQRVRIDGPASVAPGSRMQLAAIGELTDGTTRDVSTEVHWSRIVFAALDLEPNGVVVGRQLGESRVTASMPVGLRPPCVKTSQLSPERRASIATTTACEPKR